MGKLLLATVQGPLAIGKLLAISKGILTTGKLLLAIETFLSHCQVALSNG
jgi:hypothetical protein